jgi:hypothetical protein
MNIEHTAGPWTVSKPSGNYIDTPAGHSVAALTYSATLADAHLIAAAPALLAALEYAAAKLISLADAETDDQEMWIIDDIERVILAAIDKATGKETDA